MTDFLERWANESEENAKLVAQELLITEVTEAIWAAMEDAGITKTELATRMGATKGHVSQILSGSRNMTLRTLSDVCLALGKKPSMSVHAKAEENGWQTISGEKLAIGRSKVRYNKTDSVIYLQAA